MENTNVSSNQNLLMRNWSTLKFVGFNILTLNTLLFVWAWNLIEKLGNESEKATNRALVIAVFATAVWGESFANAFDEDVLYIVPFLAFLGAIAMTAEYILLIILSFKIKPLLENYFEGEGKAYKLNPVWCFIFPLYYQYYVIYNIETLALNKNPASNNDDVYNQIEKLQKLKDSGAISEDEFQNEKNKLLTKSK